MTQPVVQLIRQCAICKAIWLPEGELIRKLWSLPTTGHCPRCDKKLREEEGFSEVEYDPEDMNYAGSYFEICGGDCQGNISREMGSEGEEP